MPIMQLALHPALSLARSFGEFIRDYDNFDLLSVISMVMSVIAFAIFNRHPLRYGRFYKPGTSKLGYEVKDRTAVCVINLIHLPVFCIISPMFEGVTILSLPAIMYVLFFLYKGTFYAHRRNRYSSPWPLESVLYYAFVSIYQSILATRIYSFSSYKFESKTDIVRGTLFAAMAAYQAYLDLEISKLRYRGDRGYKIPKDGIFKFCSCPYYAMEVLIWADWIMFFRFDTGCAAYLLWLLPNIYGRSENTHKWYKRFFKSSYPSKRTAIIPFINISQILHFLGGSLEYGIEIL